MRLTVESFIQQSTRVRRVMDYLGACLDEDISLATLADVACLSPSAFERLYRRKVRETPMATLRRLRLQRAAAQIACSTTDLVDIGLAAGYGSAAAFTHAFVRQFGRAPSQWRMHSPPSAPRVSLRLEQLPERPVLHVRYSGAWRERLLSGGVLAGSLAVAGARRWRAWQVLDRDHPLLARPHEHVTLTHFVPAAEQPHTVRGLDRATHAGGLYAVCEMSTQHVPRSLSSLGERVREHLHCQLIDEPFLLREINVSAYTAPQERRIALYVPVERRR